MRSSSVWSPSASKRCSRRTWRTKAARAAVAQKLAEFQRDPKAWLAANLNPRLGEHTPKGYEAFSNATMDWNIWVPRQTSTSGMGRDTATAQENAKAAIKE